VHDSEGGPDAPIDLLDRRAFVREVDPHLTRLFWGGDIEREQPEEQQKVEAQIVMESAVPRLENGAGRLLGSDGEDIDKTCEAHGAGGEECDPSPPFGPDGEPQIHAGRRNEQQQIDSSIGQPAPQSDPEPVPTQISIVWARHLVQIGNRSSAPVERLETTAIPRARSTSTIASRPGLETGLTARGSPRT